MPHLHLSLQSGDDMILKRMKRRHSRADAVRFCEEARRLRPDIVFGADLIAGFPTETEAMFAELAAPRRRLRPDLPARLSLSRRARARRPRACRRSPARVVKERAARLRDKGDAALAAYLRGAGRQRGRAADRARRASGARRSSPRWRSTHPAAAGQILARPRHRVRRQAVAGRADRPQVWRRERQACQIPRPVRPVPPFRGGAGCCACGAEETPTPQRQPSAAAAEPRDRRRAAEETGLVPAPQGRADQDLGASVAKTSPASSRSGSSTPIRWRSSRTC